MHDTSAHYDDNMLVGTRTPIIICFLITYTLSEHFVSIDLKIVTCIYRPIYLSTVYHTAVRNTEQTTRKSLTKSEILALTIYM